MTEANVLMKWTLNHKQRGNHCPQCLELAGQVKTMLEWSMTTKPGFHKGCGCSLEVCAGASERDNAPPESPPKERDNAKKSKGSTGEGPGHGSRGGSVTRPDDPPPNQDNSHTNQPKAPEPDPALPTPPPATPPDVIYVPKGKPVAT